MRNQLLTELYILLDAERVLLLEGGEITKGHRLATQVTLESLGVSGLAQPLDGI